jgi:hypothetical protein
MSTTTTHARETEATILSRVLCEEDGQLPAELARFLLERDFSERDKARMHDLAVRNQQGALSPAEAEVLFAFCRAGEVLAILQSKARRALGTKPRKRTGA